MKKGETMKPYLQRYLQDFPGGTLQDTLKYLFQTYGPSHIRMDSRIIDYLHQEIESLQDIQKHENLYDQAGPHFVRINLRPFMKYNLDPQWLAANFIKSNSQDHPPVHWPSLRELLLESGYAAADVDCALTKLEGRPSISHSAEYHQHYHPAYRLLKKTLLTEEIIFLQAKIFLDQLPERKLKIIAIDGMCAGGKTTLATHLSQHYQATVIHADDFFDNADAKIGINSERLKTEILERAVMGKSLTYHKYDCTKKIMVPERIETVKEWLIIEGAFSGNARLFSAYDAVLFVDIDQEEQLRRLSQRSKSLLSRFQNEWIPRENRYFQEEQLYLKADLIL